MQKKSIYIIFISLFLFSVCSYTQLVRNSRTMQAMYYFNNKQYSEALKLYEKLITDSPDDQYYKYYTGVCMYNMNVNLSKAEVLLLSASESYVPVDVYYYLGRIYHLQQKYREAIENYNKYLIFTGKQNAKASEIKMLIQNAFYGYKIQKPSGEIEYKSSDTLRLEYITDFLNTLKINGRYEIYKEKYLSELDIKNTSNYFFSTVKKNGDTIRFICASANSKKNNIDIFEVIYDDSLNSSRIVTLSSIINTEYDENYVFYDTDSSVLYFSSKGFNSIGGYDIFYSKYDNMKKEWSIPVNAGLPLNSPYDDIFYVVEKSKRIVFASNRDLPLNDNRFIIYSITPELQKIIINMSESNNKLLPKQNNNVTNRIANNDTLSEYYSMIINALNRQRYSDSLELEKYKCSLALLETSDKTQRRVLFSEISRLTSLIKNEQLIINEKYVHLKEYEESNLQTSEFHNGYKEINDDVNTEFSLLYRIQLGIFSSPADSLDFNMEITSEKIESSNLYRIYTGNYTKYDKAYEYSKYLENKGFKGAFVVAWYKGVKIPAYRAKSMEEILQQ